MRTAPITSDDVDTEPMEFADFDDIDWDADPAAILERRELEFGVNCFDQPIY